jgi:hypothetical protein
MQRKAFSFLLVLLASAHLARAQGLAPDPSFRNGIQPLAVDLASAGRSCLERVPPSALHRTPVYASVDLPDSGNVRFRGTLENFLQDVAQHVSPLLGHSRDTLVAAEPAVTWRGLGAPLRLTWYADGRLTWVVDQTRDDTAAAALLGRAVSATMADGDVLVPDNGTPFPDSVVFRIKLDWPLTAADGHVTPPRFRHTALPVFTIDYPGAEPVAMGQHVTVPRYPDEARRRGYQASVMLEFMVDTAGRAEAKTIKSQWPLGKAPLVGEAKQIYDTFVSVSKGSAERSEFRPARVGGCAVRQLVEMPFVFELTRDP